MPSYCHLECHSRQRNRMRRVGNFYVVTKPSIPSSIVTVGLPLLNAFVPSNASNAASIVRVQAGVILPVHDMRYVA